MPCTYRWRQPDSRKAIGEQPKATRLQTSNATHDSVAARKSIINMARFSFFDHEKRDFLRYDNGQLIVIEAEDFHEAEDWLLTEGETYGWTNTGVNYYNWDDELKLQAPR